MCDFFFLEEVVSWKGDMGNGCGKGWGIFWGYDWLDGGGFGKDCGLGLLSFGSLKVLILREIVGLWKV